MTKTAARICILSEVLSFPTIGNTNWTSCGFGSEPQIGDLVAVYCAPPTKYYLSWVREINPNGGWPKYLLESIDDEELCWWENVGLSYYNRERVSNHPSWRWDDAQFDFYRRWKTVCRRNDAYIVMPCEPVFMDDGSVLLDVRVRFHLDGYHNPVIFQNWKKVTMKMMDDYYKKVSKEYEERR